MIQYQTQANQKQLAIELSSVILDWCERLQQNNVQQVELEGFRQIGAQLLYFLIRASIMYHTSQENSSKD